jgi:hypothetical protein
MLLQRFLHDCCPSLIKVLQHTFLNIHHVSGYGQALYNYPHLAIRLPLDFDVRLAVLALPCRHDRLHALGGDSPAIR